VPRGSVGRLVCEVEEFGKPSGSFGCGSAEVHNAVTEGVQLRTQEWKVFGEARGDENVTQVRCGVTRFVPGC
jgi:hypothetical protein